MFSIERLILSDTTLAWQIKKKIQLFVSVLEYICISVVGAGSYNTVVVFQNLKTTDMQRVLRRPVSKARYHI